MLYKFRNQLARALYDYYCRRILDTPPLLIRPTPLVFCSMVSRRDVIMYLVAIKSVYSRIGEGVICIVNDGSLQSDDINLLKHHLGSPHIVDVAAIDTGQCPRGGTWERLLHILDLTDQSYVIQVDSDIVARGPLVEVRECYRANQSFTLGSWAGQDFKTLAEAAIYAKTVESSHVQISAERGFGSLESTADRRYVRGSSGFAGFARGGASRRMATYFSVEMERLLGNKWSEWGSEQVTSCYIVANTPGGKVLPWPKYTNFSENTDPSSAVLLHFVGDRRFFRGRYAKESRRIIAELKS